MTSRLSFAFLGLSITSTWGNGHATTYRSLLRELGQRGHRVTFFERAVPWYTENADLPAPPYCELVLYDSLEDLGRHRSKLAQADVVVLGSYVPQGRKVAELVLQSSRALTAFYDIDTPVTLAALARNDCEYLSPELVPAFDIYLSFSGGRSLELLRSTYGARRAEPLYCSVDPAYYHPEITPKRWDLGYLGTYSADRQPELERLLLEPARQHPELSLAVAGSQYPSSIAWPSCVTHFEHVPAHEHRGFYARQRWTLNLTRRDMALLGHSPSVRLFEAAACGTPILSDHWRGLEQFFEPEREIVVVSSGEQVVTCLKQRGEAERKVIAERARARVLEEHTSSARAKTLLEYVQAGASPSTRTTARPLTAGAEQAP